MDRGDWCSPWVAKSPDTTEGGIQAMLPLQGEKHVTNPFGQRLFSSLFVLTGTKCLNNSMARSVAFKHFPYTKINPIWVNISQLAFFHGLGSGKANLLQNSLTHTI